MERQKQKQAEYAAHFQASKATIAERVDEILRIRLDGAKAWDVRRYVAEKEAEGKAPWTLPEGGKPLSERQIRRYCNAADKLIERDNRTTRRRLRHGRKAKLDAMYARCISAGDFRAALAVIRELNAMDGLYPDPANTLLREARELKHRLDEAEAGPHQPPASTQAAAPTPATDPVPTCQR